MLWLCFKELGCLLFSFPEGCAVLFNLPCGICRGEKKGLVIMRLASGDPSVGFMKLKDLFIFIVLAFDVRE